MKPLVFGRLHTGQPLLHCPLLGRRHVWKVADGWLREPRRDKRGPLP